ncbi:DUF3567 domain-containing protein [Mycoavidus sp. B2-EB]|uniref:BTH_I0359 family protein n=1 Tax=Mycoavidus sp. B2-EB TaxID=2651972 RepID=UPI001624ECB4|nr:DUF3567 domain-containing protein [Mycoavidus sp. B2-EB]BBO60446.1 hypothetical protein MPB2EB_1587 [Mycoavidus sp. B2-EB]
MQMIYNSQNYCIVEFPAQVGSFALKTGGYEIVAKNLQRELFIDGAMAEQFRENVQKLIELQPSTDEIDDFLGQFDSLMTHPVVLH